MIKKRILDILVTALLIILILAFVWEVVSIINTMRSIDEHLTKIESDLSAIETLVAPDGPIDQSLDGIDEMLGTPTPIPVP